MNEIKNLKLVKESEIETEDIFEGDDDPYGILSEGLSDEERYGQGFTIGDEVPSYKRR